MWSSTLLSSCFRIFVCACRSTGHKLEARKAHKSQDIASLGHQSSFFNCISASPSSVPADSDSGDVAEPTKEVDNLNSDIFYECVMNACYDHYGVIFCALAHFLTLESKNPS